MSKRFRIFLICLACVILIVWLTAPPHIGEGRATRVRFNAAKRHLTDFQKALEHFKADLGYYPATADGLDLLNAMPAHPPKNWKGPYLKTVIPDDPWGEAYRYLCPGTHNPQSYDLLSAGPDGMFDSDDDIANYPTGNN